MGFCRERLHYITTVIIRHTKKCLFCASGETKCLDVNINRYQDMMQGVWKYHWDCGCFVGKTKALGKHICCSGKPQTARNQSSSVGVRVFSSVRGQKAQVLSKLVNQTFVRWEHWYISVQVQSQTFLQGQGSGKKTMCSRLGRRPMELMLIMNNLLKEM